MSFPPTDGVRGPRVDGLDPWYTTGAVSGYLGLDVCPTGAHTFQHCEPDAYRLSDGMAEPLVFEPGDIAMFANHLPPQGALLGLDPGTKTVGVAVSDRTRMVSSGVETIRRTKFKADGARLLALIDELTISGLVMGLPLNMDGSEGPRAQSVRAFTRNLVAITPLPIQFWDERLTTAQAERTLLEADTSRKRRAQVIDQLAAGLILQGALDRLRSL